MAKGLGIKLKGNHDDMARRYQILLCDVHEEVKIGLACKPIYERWRRWLAFTPRKNGLQLGEFKTRREAVLKLVKKHIEIERRNRCVDRSR